MATKIRLQRFGHKDYAFYQIVIADSRAPRDGKFIERIGSYNPNTNPATINLNFERALYWLTTGAQPTDTVRNILSKEGVLMKKHLLGGVKKGAFTEEVAEQRFEAWLKNKKSAIDAEKAKVSAAKDAAAKKRLEEETEKNKAKAEVVAAKKQPRLPLRQKPKPLQKRKKKLMPLQKLLQQMQLLHPKVLNKYFRQHIETEYPSLDTPFLFFFFPKVF